MITVTWARHNLTVEMISVGLQSLQGDSTINVLPYLLSTLVSSLKL